MNNYCIYIHRNKINNKVYIGQTCQKPEKRWNYGLGYKNSPYFFAAIQLYGWDNFSHEILETGLSLEQANEREQYYIEKYNSTNQKFGYNLNKGGSSLNAYWQNEQNRLTKSEEKKQFFATHPDEKKANDNHLKKIAQDSAEIRSQKMKENYQKQQGLYEINQERKKLIICEETQEIFSSLTEAGKKYNISVSNISNVIHGKRKTAGGFHWRALSQESMN